MLFFSDMFYQKTQKHEPNMRWIAVAAPSILPLALCIIHRFYINSLFEAHKSKVKMDYWVEDKEKHRSLKSLGKPHRLMTLGRHGVPYDLRTLLTLWS